MIFMVATISCMKWDYSDELEDFEVTSSGLFILSEGNFQYSNATLSFYNPLEKTVQNEVFFKANGMKLGDVAQSMTIYGNRAWIVVNNSHVIFAIDPDTFKEVGRIENLTSPRYIYFLSPEKAYVTQIWDNRIFIVNPSTYSIKGYITVPEMTSSSGSTEQMLKIGNFIYCNCWSYQNRILKIDPENDRVIDQIEVGIQPNSITKDKEGKLWVLTDGGFDGSPYGYEPPSLICIDPENLRIEKIFYFNLGDEVSELQTDAKGENLFWINGDIWEMNISSQSLPEAPLISSRDTRYYGLTISPENGDIYVADAIDYSQLGMIYRYDRNGDLMDSFYVGISPGAFCWKDN